MSVRIKTEAVYEIAARTNRSIRVMAHDSGTDYNYLLRLMRGEHEPSPRVRQRLCERWNVGFDDIFRLDVCGAVR